MTLYTFEVVNRRKHERIFGSARLYNSYDEAMRAALNTFAYFNNAVVEECEIGMDIKQRTDFGERYRYTVVFLDYEYNG